MAVLASGCRIGPRSGDEYLAHPGSPGQTEGTMTALNAGALPQRGGRRGSLDDDLDDLI